MKETKKDNEKISKTKVHFFFARINKIDKALGRFAKEKPLNLLLTLSPKPLAHTCTLTYTIKP